MSKTYFDYWFDLDGDDEREQAVAYQEMMEAERQAEFPKLDAIPRVQHLPLIEMLRKKQLAFRMVLSAKLEAQAQDLESSAEGQRSSAGSAHRDAKMLLMQKNYGASYMYRRIEKRRRGAAVRKEEQAGQIRRRISDQDGRE